ncbi:hypothetical protein B0H13DRAFT_1868733 [Mycena leptocephala]|nr:hypothetical protein B0H13DRAFT_1868733 [Mycena leptocephala]
MFLFLCLKFDQMSRGVCGDKCSSDASGGGEVRVFYVPDHASECTETNTTFQIILADLWDDTANVQFRSSVFQLASILCPLKEIEPRDVSGVGEARMIIKISPCGVESSLALEERHVVLDSSSRIASEGEKDGADGLANPKIGRAELESEELGSTTRRLPGSTLKPRNYARTHLDCARLEGLKYRIIIEISVFALFRPWLFKSYAKLMAGLWYYKPQRSLLWILASTFALDYHIQPQTSTLYCGPWRAEAMAKRLKSIRPWFTSFHRNHQKTSDRQYPIFANGIVALASIGRNEIGTTRIPSGEVIHITPFSCSKPLKSVYEHSGILVHTLNPRSAANSSEFGACIERGTSPRKAYALLSLEIRGDLEVCRIGRVSA